MAEPRQFLKPVNLVVSAVVGDGVALLKDTHVFRQFPVRPVGNLWFAACSVFLMSVRAW